MRHQKVFPKFQYFQKCSLQTLARIGTNIYPCAKAPYVDAKGATHCLAEIKKLPNQKLNFEALAEQRVAVVGPLYINKFLINDPPPSVEEFLID